MKKVFATTLAVCVVSLPIGAAISDGEQQVQQVQQTQTIQVGPPMGIEGGMLPGPRQLKTGTGRIRGRLVASDTGTAVRRAQVRISSSDIMPKTAITDAEGRYEFKDLPASKFTISASKPGFVTMNYGQKRPFESGTTIELAEAQSLDKADIAMPRGSDAVGPGALAPSRIENTAVAVALTTESIIMNSEAPVRDVALT